MKTYAELVKEYKKRQHDTVVDTLAAGLTYMDNIAVESGLLEETGVLGELSEGVCGALPFVIISVTEGGKVILGRKPGRTALKDGAWRMTKTGAALGVGAAVASAAGLWAAIPATMGVRALFDRWKSRTLTDVRVRSRIARLKELNAHLRGEELPVLPETPPEEALPVAGDVS